MIGYVDSQTLTSWASARGITLSQDADALLTRALDWVELQRYGGHKTDPNQELQWPRVGTGYPSDSVPEDVKALQLRIAVDIDAGMDPLGQRKAGRKSASVHGAVSVTYFDGETDSRISAQAQALLAKLTRGAGSTGVFQIEVSRG